MKWGWVIYPMGDKVDETHGTARVDCFFRWFSDSYFGARVSNIFIVVPGLDNGTVGSVRIGTFFFFFFFPSVVTLIPRKSDVYTYVVVERYRWGSPPIVNIIPPYLGVMCPLKRECNSKGLGPTWICA